MINISVIKNHVEVLHNTSAIEVFKLIRNPESPHKQVIEEIRSLQKLGSSEEVSRLKKTLFGITFSGIFRNRRTIKNLESYSGMIVLDLDELSPAQLIQAKERINFIPYTYMCFTSPTGTGLKAVIKVNSNFEQHKDVYSQVLVYYEEEVGEKFDKATNDVTRLTYISYDPDAHINENSAVFQIDLTKVKKSKSKSNISLTEGEVDVNKMKDHFKTAVQFTERKHTFEEGNRHNFLLQLACNCNRYGIPVDHVLNFCIDEYVAGWDEKEIRSIIGSVYNKYIDESGIWKEFVDKRYSKISNGDSAKNSNEEENGIKESAFNTPTIPISLVYEMPCIIKDIALILANDREKDVFITGIITILSGCFNNIQGVYDGRVVYPNLFSFIIASAASGKGALNHARDLADHLHEKTLEISNKAKKQYQKDYEKYQEEKGNGKNNVEKPERPPYIMLFVPGNSSSAGIYDHLNECDGVGIVCETEADTVNTCLKNDWGNYSDLLRKSFQHEVVSSRRKQNKEHIEVKKPKLSVVLSGTPSQVQGLIKSAEDGLFSRFLFYRFDVIRKWRDVSPKNGKYKLPELIEEKAKELTNMVEYLRKYPSNFELTEQQWDKLNMQFTKWLDHISCFLTEEAGATVVRLGLCTFRVAMILSAIRKYEMLSKEEKVICCDKYFNIALQLVDVYIQHAVIMYKEMPSSSKGLNGKPKQFYDILLTEFSRDTAKKLAAERGLRMSDSWIDKWLKRFISYGFLTKCDYNIYRKIQSSNNEQEVCSNQNLSAPISEIEPKDKAA